jgi:dTDP-4-amino-4,6-dideoxygalactose transaminase
VDEFVAVNRDNHARYAAGLEGIPGISLLRYDPAEASNYQYVVLEVDEAEAGIDRDTLQRVLHAENVLARRYFFPGVHRMEPYRSYFPQARLHLPQTERLTRRVLSLPTGTAVGEAEVAAVCAIVRTAAEGSAELAERLRGGTAPAARAV